MKRLIWIFAALFLATPLFAQDEGPSSPFAGGGGGAQVFTRVDEVNPMEPVKAFLAKVKITLSGDQEKALKPSVDAAFKQMHDATDKYAAQTGGQRAGEAPQGERRGGGFGRGGGGPDGGGRRGGGQGGTAFPGNPALNAELKKINDDLLLKITAVLKPDQQAVFKKYQNDQIKAAGGFGALKVVMEEAGAPLTPEQEPQILGFYSEDAQQRTQLLRQSQGQADPAKLAELERGTMAKVVKVLNAAQRKALLDSMKAQAQAPPAK